MKKFIAIGVLVLFILSTLISGVLALYSTKADEYQEESATAARFVLSGETLSGRSSAGITIAPGDYTYYSFDLKNYDATGATETDMKVEISATLAAAAGKKAIPELRAALYRYDGNAEGEKIGDVTLEAGVGQTVFTLDREFTANVEKTSTFALKIEWPNSETNTLYQGSEYGTVYSVSVVGTQIVNSTNNVNGTPVQ